MSEDAYRNFLHPRVMAGEDWKALEFATHRLLSHCGWKNIQYVGESGDKGGDLLAVRYNPKLSEWESYLIQVKAVSGANYVGKGAVDQAIQGQAHYGSKIVIIATNGDFTSSAEKRKNELRAQRFDVRLWNGKFLHELLDRWPEYSPLYREPRPYQQEIINTVLKNYYSDRAKSLFIVATGLGKTVISATITDRLIKEGLKRVLVLCHSVDLTVQLQQEFWNQIPKSVHTRLFMAGDPPVSYEGINFGLYQTLFGYLGGLEPDSFDLIIVDEAHHALANAFATCIEHLKPRHLIGMTATPWRSDGATIESLFGESIAQVSLVDGMRMGYLARVDYRLMCDNIDWKEIPKLSKRTLSIKDLNKSLFIPQRDEAIISNLVSAAAEINNPKIAVFSPSISHAKEFARKLTSSGLKAACASIPDKVKRRRILLDFASGKLNTVTAVDVLNEGIDVPDLNILVFLRATHSRRIFVQQLGRGLRIAPGKEKVVVLDFVTDIRRIAAVCDIDKEARYGKAEKSVEHVYLRDGVVSFKNDKVQSFVDAWLQDVADLQDMEDAEKLTFPDTKGGNR